MERRRSPSASTVLTRPPRRVPYSISVLLCPGTVFDEHVSWSVLNDGTEEVK